MNFEDNFTCFSWLLNFISSTVIQDELRQNQIISVEEKASQVTILAQIKTLPEEREERMLQGYTAITTTSTTVIGNANIQPQV